MAVPKDPPASEELDQLRKAAQSIVTEQRVAETLGRLGWRVERNVHYQDPKRDQRREMDVLATRTWDRPDGRLVVVRLQLVVEAKSMAGANIIVAEEDEGAATGERCYFSWLGLDEPDLRGRMREALASAGATDDLIGRVMSRAEELTYPAPEHASMMHDLIADAPAPPHHATTLRFSSERPDAGRSHAYNGLLAALACVEGLAQASVKTNVESLRHDVQTALEDGDDVEESVAEIVASALSVMTLFHPLVVSGAVLWSGRGGTMADIPWCRVHDFDAGTRERRWVDMVSLEHFEDFAVSITAWYDSFFGDVEAFAT